MAKLNDNLFNRVIQGKLSLESTDDLSVVDSAIENAKPKFELITELGAISVTRTGTGEGDDPYQFEAGFSKSEYKLPSYDLYIFAMNGSFVITPLAQANTTTKLALCVGSFAYDEIGNSMVGRLRIVSISSGSGSLSLTFDSKFAEGLYDSGITPSGYLFGIKL